MFWFTKAQFISALKDGVSLRCPDENNQQPMFAVLPGASIGISIDQDIVSSAT
jgi:hypothetical protein